MESVVLTDPSTGSTARIAAHLGFNCYAFRAVVDGRPIDVIDAPDDFAESDPRPSAYGIPLLFPFPNRIRRGRYIWKDRSYELSPDNVGFDPLGNAIHGFCLDRPWRVISQAKHYALGQFRLSVDAPDRLSCWPADFVIEVRYELRGSALRADILIANPVDRPLPWGFGTHPYFRLPLAAESDPAGCIIEAPAGRQWELSDYLPTGERSPVRNAADLREGVPFGQLQLDDALCGLEADSDAMGCLIMDETAGLQVTQRTDSCFRELVVYTPPGRDAVCLEPYTCVTDAVNLEPQGIDAGWRCLEPGETFETWIEIRAGAVIA